MSYRRALLRKNASGASQYKLNFDSTYNDYASYGSGVSWITYNNCIVEVEFSGLTGTSSTVMGIFGQHRASGTTERWFINWRGSDNTFFVRLGSRVLDFTNTATSGVIRIEGDGTSCRSYLDGVLQTTAGVITASASSSYLLNIGVANDSTGTAVDTGSCLDGSVHYAMIDDGTTVTTWDINEGSGNTTTSDQGDVMTIYTSNGGGLSYINSVMWEAY